MHDDAVHEFEPGVGMLALRSGAPVVPVGLRGSGDPVFGGRPGLPVVRLKAGPPVDLSGLTGKKSADVRTGRRSHTGSRRGAL